MACNNPFYAQLETFVDKRTGEVCNQKLHIVSSLRKELKKEGGRILFAQTADGERALAKNGNSLMLIPCGKCLGCKMDRARDWGARAYLESIGKTGNFFVTLTLSPEGMAVHGEDVRPDMVSTFMKRLRKRFGAGIRFFACGEYGSKTHRAHYHVLLYNAPFDLDADGVLIGANERGDRWFQLPALDDQWWLSTPEGGRQNLGYVTVSPLTVETCAYVARYCSKKQDDFFLDELEADGRKKPFLQMSRNPGIAREWIDFHAEELYAPETDGKVSLGKDQRIIPPKYFRARADSLGVDRSVHVDRTRDRAYRSLLKHLKDSDYNEADWLEIRELNLEEKNLKWIRQIE